MASGERAAVVRDRFPERADGGVAGHAPERYAASVGEAFLTGSSAADFSPEDYERSWPDRFSRIDSTTSDVAVSAWTDQQSPPSVRADDLDSRPDSRFTRT